MYYWLMKILLLITIAILSVGCGEKATVEPVAEVKPKPEGVNAYEFEEREGIRYLKDSETPYTGKVISLYENGQKEHETNIKNGEVDGLSVYWYENGQKKHEANYKDGEKISENHWNEEGELLE
jgi:antitoxin component YwqK of YwqJK toxin-antitoxin module|tara:strand:- start:812 stop:1183 length:372 start_codon:yes stop_codon:yes gene_type:complete